MSPMSIAVIAFGMSIDSGVACIGRGAGGARPTIGDAVLTGLLFGLVEAITPVIGWAAGLAARSYVVALDHWIAFGLLGFLGARMVLHGIQGSQGAAVTPTKGSLLVLFATAVGTSIDAMAVGASLAFLRVDILVVALAVGTTTFIFALGGVLIGRLIGQRLGRWAEIAGGAALAGLGLSILIEHLLA
jgi:putative Mn2+ efflux pump MntP